MDYAFDNCVLTLCTPSTSFLYVHSNRNEGEFGTVIGRFIRAVQSERRVHSRKA